MKKQTCRVQINRTNTTNEPNKGVYIPLMTEDRIILEFQCNEGTTPTISNLMKMQEPNQPTPKGAVQ